MSNNRTFPLKLVTTLLTLIMIAGCSNNSLFSGSDLSSINLSSAASEEMTAVNAAMSAAEILYRRANQEQLSYYAPMNYAQALKQRGKLLGLYEDFDPENSSWFSGSSSDEIIEEADLFVQRINKAFQAKAITEPRLKVIRDHDQYIQQIDVEGFSSRIAQLRGETEQFAGMMETKSTVIGLEHKQTQLEFDYQALEVNMVKRKVLMLPTEEFHKLDEELVPESYKTALAQLYALERLIEKDPRDNKAIQESLNASFSKIKQAASIAREVEWVKARIETSAERVVLNYRNHLSKLNQYLGTQSLTSLDFQSQIEGIKDAVENKLTHNNDQLQKKLAALAEVLTGQDMSHYSAQQQVDRLIAAAQSSVDESLAVSFPNQ